MLPLVPAGARSVLDVGCGSGGFGAALRRADPGRLVWGVEPVPEVAALARRYYDRVIVEPYPEALQGCGRTFDCIVFNDVLEHLADPWAALRATLPYLEPQGTVVASIPNVRNIRVVMNLVLRGDWTYTESGVLDRTHLRFFTGRTIATLFADTGFVVGRVEGIHVIGSGRFRCWKVIRFLLRDFAYNGFAVSAAPDHRESTA
jgi:2-polyprenyl-3-methyl-5-hydroxy-6-metoxy-1,4-benzoquinol methylase